MIRSVPELREQADRCRRLAKGQTNKGIADNLRDMARQFDDLADELERDAREGGVS